MLALGLLFLAGAGGSWLGLAKLRQPLAFEEFRVEESPPVPVERVRLRERSSSPAHFLLFHGYGANRRQLLHLAEVLAAAGGDVYLMDLPGRGDHAGGASPRPRAALEPDFPTPVENQAAQAVFRHLERQYGVRADRLVLIGHSLGGGVALDLGREIRPRATISLAGLEREVGPGQPPNLLLVTAQFEIPALRRAADRMREAAGPAAGRQEFLSTHASLPFHPPLERALVKWTNQALPEGRLAIPRRFPESLLAAELTGLVCLGGLFVPLAALAGWLAARQPFGEVVAETRFSFWSPVHFAGYGLLAGGVSVAVLAWLEARGWPYPLSFLGLDGGDYLGSLLVLSTPWLLPGLRQRPWVRSWGETTGRIAAAMVLAAYVMVAVGGFLTWQLFDLWPTRERALALVLLSVVLFPYVLGEELLARSFALRRGASPGSALLAWRAGLAAAVFLAAWGLGRGDTLVALLTFPLLLLSLAEVFFSQALYRGLGSVYASAGLRAVLIGWFIATVFPLR